MPGSVFLEGDHVALRTIEEEDMKTLNEIASDPRVWRPFRTPIPYNLEQEQSYFENIISDNESTHLLITAEDTPVGMIILDPTDQRSGVTEVGYYLGPTHWGQGFATEATQLIVQYSFDHLRIHKITAQTVEFNNQSQHILEKIGFTKEGVQREQTFIDGEHQDVFWYGLLVDEWRN